MGDRTTTIENCSQMQFPSGSVRDPEVSPTWPDFAPRQDLPARWQEHDRKDILDTPWMFVARYKVTAPTGQKADYGVYHFKNRATGVVALYDNGDVVMVGQQRFAVGHYSWELPEGGAPQGEDPLLAIKRELAEEAGLQATHWREILVGDLSNSVTDEAFYLYVAFELSPAPSKPDETEVLSCVRVPFSQLIAAIEEQQIRDSMTIMALYRVYHMAATGQIPEPYASAILKR